MPHREGALLPVLFSIPGICIRLRPNLPFLPPLSLLIRPNPLSPPLPPSLKGRGKGCTHTSLKDKFLRVGGQVGLAIRPICIRK
jgi:hypothetical protein